MIRGVITRVLDDLADAAAGYRRGASLERLEHLASRLGRVECERDDAREGCRALAGEVATLKHRLAAAASHQGQLVGDLDAARAFARDVVERKGSFGRTHIAQFIVDRLIEHDEELARLRTNGARADRERNVAIAERDKARDGCRRLVADYANQAEVLREAHAEIEALKAKVGDPS